MKTEWAQWKNNIRYSYKGHHGLYLEQNGDSYALTAVSKIPLGDENTM